MRIIVCIKRVPSERNVKIDKNTGVLIRDPEKLIINEFDKCAINKAIEIKKSSDENVEIIGLSMSDASDLLLFRECLALGIDKIVVLSDKKFSGSDAWATANTLKAGIKKIGDFDLILTGKVSSDGETGQIGIRLAEKLDIECITSIDEINYSKEKGFNVSRKFDGKIEKYTTKNKLLCTINRNESVKKYLSLSSILKAYNDNKICVYSADDLDLDESKIGLKSSTTYVKKTYTREKSKDCMYINDIEELKKELGLNIE